MPVGNEQYASVVKLSASKRYRISCGCLGENELGVGPHGRWHCKLLKGHLAQCVKVLVRSL